MNTRSETLVNESVVLMFRNLNGGALTDAVTIPSVELVNPSGAVVQTFSAPNVVRDDVGFYHVQIPAGVLTELGEWTDLWSVDNGVGVTTVPLRVQVNNFRAPAAPDWQQILNVTLSDLTPCYLKSRYLSPVAHFLSSYSISDSQIQSIIDVMISRTSRLLGMPLRRVRVMTPPFAENKPAPVKGVDYDMQGELLQWSKVNAESWMSFRLPRSDVKRVRAIRGVLGGKVVFHIPDSWVDRNELQTGFVKVRPNTLGASSVIFSQSMALVDPTLVEQYGANTVPGFWAVDYDYGDDEVALEIADAICKMASARLLEFISTAIMQGVGSRSASLDGMSSSVSYMATTERGMFSSLQTRYEMDLQVMDWDEMKKFYKGISTFII